jgi:uncharacterized protein (DUF608 family)
LNVHEGFETNERPAMKFSLRTISDSSPARSGVYVGGIGAGGFEVRPDGVLHCRQIFNEWRKREPLDAFFIYENGKERRLLRLADYSPTGERIAGVSAVTYTGEFPCVKLEFPGLNVSVEFLSFFVPGDLKNSSIPSVLMRVKGKGRLMFMLGGMYKDVPAINGPSVVLKSPEGGLGMTAGKGKPRAYAKGDRWLAIKHMVEPHCRLKQAVVTAERPRECYAAMYWDGSFDDEAVIGWHYPGSLDNEGKFMGQWYANHFDSCESVLAYVARNKSALKRKTLAFHARVHRSGQPAFLRDSYAAQVSSFVKQSWLTKDGLFGVWEGSCCCCGLQTTDVAYYGSWIYASLFPELEKAGLRLTAKFQREDGWIPHFFPGVFTRIDEYRRKDMNMQFVLMAYRDYRLWKDRGFIIELYPSIKRAMLCAYGWDKDGDLIPDVEPAAQTFDSWNFTGCAIYTASLWLASLVACEKIAALAHDEEFSRRCGFDAERVRKNILARLWNNEYFILAMDGGKRDEGCLLDGLSGDWYARLCGLGGIFDDRRVMSHLNACLIYNRKKFDISYMTEYGTPGEDGFCYINGGYPDNRRVGWQQYEPWTGMEYAYAVHLAVMGKKKQALQVVKDVHDRKIACGMTYNHAECGGDYFRPMVIAALWDMVTGKLPIRK